MAPDMPERMNEEGREQEPESLQWKERGRGRVEGEETQAACHPKKVSARVNLGTGLSLGEFHVKQKWPVLSPSWPPLVESS